MEKLQLNEDFFIGAGSHKKCYRHPLDKTKCVEIIYSADGLKDVRREMKFRRYMAKHSDLDYSILPIYYGECETNLGKGYVYEFIAEEDGQFSLTLQDYFQQLELLERDFDVLVELMQKLKKIMLANEIITMNLTEENIVVQETVNGKNIRLISDLGSAFFLPIDYWFRSVRIKRVHRHWKKMCQSFKKRFACPIVEKFVEAIG